MLERDLRLVVGGAGEGKVEEVGERVKGVCLLQGFLAVTLAEVVNNNGEVGEGGWPGGKGNTEAREKLLAKLGGEVGVGLKKGADEKKSD